MQTLERILWDDDDHIAGIDVRQQTSHVDARQILRFYEPESKCYITGAPASTIIPADGDASNFLYTNLLPVTDDVARAFSPYPIGIIGAEFRILDVTVSAHVEVRVHADDSPAGRLSDRFYAALNPLITTKQSESGVMRLPLDAYKVLLPPDVPHRMDILALQFWQTLQVAGNIKGLTRVKVTANATGVDAFVTKQMLLRYIIASLASLSGRNRIVQAGQSHILVPSPTR